MFTFLLIYFVEIRVSKNLYRARRLGAKTKTHGVILFSKLVVIRRISYDARCASNLTVLIYNFYKYCAVLFYSINHVFV